MQNRAQVGVHCVERAELLGRLWAQSFSLVEVRAGLRYAKVSHTFHRTFCHKEYLLGIFSLVYRYCLLLISLFYRYCIVMLRVLD
jgi:hypothetical protein